MVGMGISAAYGISTTSINSSVTECTIPAMGVRPPFFTLAAVLAMAPVAGIPPNNAEVMLPAPWAINSMLERCLLFTMLSATTQESRDSIAARIAMVKASGRTFCTVFRLKDGREIVGSLLEISYRSPMVFTFILSSATMALPTSTAISEGGIFLQKPGRYCHTIRISRLITPTRRACRLVVDIN